MMARMNKQDTPASACWNLSPGAGDEMVFLECRVVPDFQWTVLWRKYHIISAVNSWIHFSPNPAHCAWCRPGEGRARCRWHCRVCWAHCSPLNLWLFGSFTQIIVPVHKTWLIAHWRSELWHVAIVQHLLILWVRADMTPMTHGWDLFIIDGSTNVASGLEN